jgi:hypothetical protein
MQPPRDPVRERPVPDSLPGKPRPGNLFPERQPREIPLRDPPGDAIGDPQGDVIRDPPDPDVADPSVIQSPTK